MRIGERLRHAFAVDPPGPAEPTADQQVAVDWVCRQVAQRHLGTASLVTLELTRPLNFVASQAMIFVSPLVWAFARKLTHDQYEHFAAFLQRRGSIDYLTRRIEHFEAELKETRDGGSEATRDQEDDGQA